jgi:hypothetical protein
VPITAPQSHRPTTGLRGWRNCILFGTDFSHAPMPVGARSRQYVTSDAQRASIDRGAVEKLVPRRRAVSARITFDVVVLGRAYIGPTNTIV